MSQLVKLEVPEFLNIGVACTSSHIGTTKENNIAMIIEDDKLGTDEITYKELAKKSDQVANFFTGIGLEPRDRVLVCLKNSLAYPISFFGTMKAGIIAVPTSTLLSGSEVKYLAEDSQARAIVLSSTMYENLVPYLENLDNLKTIVVAGIDSVEDLKKPKDINVYALNQIFKTIDSTPNHYKSKSGEPAYLVYTSGTTGYPKGVLHSHRSLVGRKPATDYWFDFKENDRIMHSGKFNWTYVLGSALMDPLYNGHTVIAYEGANDATTWINLIKKHQCTIFIGVPTIYRQIIQKTDFTLDDCPSLRYCMSAGEHLSDEMLGLWRERFKQDIYEAIGMSECSYYISHSKYNPIRPGSAGFPQPGHIVKLINPETLEEVGLEEEGMICIGEDDPGLFLEYWQLEEETAKSRHDGYFFTGDYARKDKDGYIWFIGRKDDIINTFGFRVSPHEIERVVKTHPLVADCVAFGLDIEKEKTLVAIAVVGHTELTKEQEEEILAFSQANLAKYKAPKRIFTMKDYPRTKNGKVLRKQLVKNLNDLEKAKITGQEIVEYKARRSMLLIPSYNKHNVEKAKTVLADTVIFDLEAILQEQREVARQTIKEVYKEQGSKFGESERVLRINNLGSEDLKKDLALAKEIELDGLLFSKIQSKDDVLEAVELINEVNPDLTLMIMIETPLAVLNIHEICAASPQVEVVVVGSNKLANRLQIDIKRGSKAMFNYLSQIALASKAYGKTVIDGPHFDVKDEFACEDSTKDAFNLGFDGKCLIHPVQIEYINDIFTPKQAEVEDYEDMIAKYEEATKEGKEVILHNDKLVDSSKIKWARKMIRLYETYKALGQNLFGK
ncbi:aldolase/citrate lyase family protein [Aliarcobacter butzleri]|uniref:aldolase/citrate lyase family protein n=1 Tax=Aliarcobacter butzleri TaxID=28197 RepID=UPI000DB8994A|nr:aldolase/citrate lyase family protein [Aliarcobacter butzleri]MCG3672584.1 aldolase/citrate lyase family protein [Aliarcobacter butzleri]MCG3681529.1 aldolase/citrate lyase family protein [Aliarcobacter butzleri]MCG3690914.1 aldolase/citrate lyase family protein [Aliarcobacter butzleri]MDN5100695.1 aldolase/citrate lyase family protein [Aliarcobacter butzleri]PZP15981.1 MAG: AMP-dependent synthetase [Aliarcobacter butzleri]